MSLSLSAFWATKHLSNDHTDDKCVDQVNLFDLLGTKVSVQCLLHGQVLFRNHFLVGIIRFLVLLLALQMLIYVVLLVAIDAKGRVKILIVGRARLLRPGLFFVTRIDAQKALGGHNGPRLAPALVLRASDGIC